MHYWRIELDYSEIYWSSPISYNLESVPREAVLDGHMVDTFLPEVKKVEKISKEQYNLLMDD
jgi:hypothetical protein